MYIYDRERGDYGLTDVTVWLWYLACSLCALREAKILHMDIKVDNILLTDGVGGFDDLVLADLGIGREVPAECQPTRGSTIAVGQAHVAFEIEDYIKNVHELLLHRLKKVNVPMATIEDVERDLAALMSRYVIDESLDMCKCACTFSGSFLCIHPNGIFFGALSNIQIIREFRGSGPPSLGERLASFSFTECIERVQ